MTQEAPYLTKITLFVACTLLGSTGSLGCGGSSEDGTRSLDVNSNLVGIYTVDTYRQSEQDACDTIADVPGPPRVVMYGVESESAVGGVALGGQFCGSADDCRARVRDRPFTTNYAFLQGNDASGWDGWGIGFFEGVGDDCVFQVQVHTLGSTGERAIQIDTREVSTRFRGEDPGDGSMTVTCSPRTAIEMITEDSPCKQVTLLEATFEQAL